MAENANLTYQRGSVREEQDEDSRLARLRLTMVLAGSYSDVRRFIYQLETAPEFVVIEHVALAQGQERSSPLVLNLEVSTYYRTGGDGI
jgi:Tfp pilus assembly protein PilO